MAANIQALDDFHGFHCFDGQGCPAESFQAHNHDDNHDDFTFEPEGMNEEVGFKQNTPSHLRGLKDFEIAFLTLRNHRTAKSHRCKN